MELIRWALTIILLGLWLFCSMFNWVVVLKLLRNKLVGKSERVSSMVPLMGGIFLIFASYMAPTAWPKGLIPAWLGVLVILFDPGSIPYLLLIAFSLSLSWVWRKLTNVLNRVRGITP